MKPKRREAVLPASIHATADFDAELPVVHQMGELLLKHVFEHGAEVGAVADGQIARVGAGQRSRRSPTRTPAHPTLGRADAVDYRQVVFDDVRQKQVLDFG